MRRILQIAPRARVDLEKVSLYLAVEAGAETAASFRDNVIAAGRKLLEFLEAFPVVELDGLPGEMAYRKLAVEGFRSHFIFYRLTHEAIVIVRVLHAACDLPRAIEDDGRV